jgi:mannose-6-phosphate isomerase-like protein (cupin superfamily)
MTDPKPTIEVFPVHAPPGLAPYGDIIETTFIKGNMGGLVVIKLHMGELAAHSHEQEHVGVVLEGEFEFFNDEDVTSLKAGDMYRIRPNVVHGIRCRNYALIVQARA